MKDSKEKLVKGKDEWIQTYSGVRFYPLMPFQGDIDIRDIAHALSNICRFTGHTKIFYSVAEHSFRAANAAHTYDVGRWLLLHDASEAYLSDVARPIKEASEFKFYREVELNLQSIIYKKFGLDLTKYPEAFVDAIDHKLFATEVRDLMPASVHKWPSLEGLIPLPDKIVPWDPKSAEQGFLLNFEIFFPEFK